MTARAAAAALAFGLASSPAPGQGTIADGPATFTLTATPWDTTPGANFTGVSPGITPDHIFETGWWYRIAGDASEKFFPVPTTQSYAGAVATITWTNVDGRGFNAELACTVIDDAGPSGRVNATMSIANPGPGPLSIDIFNFADFDLQPTIGNDVAMLVAANSHMRITDAGTNFAEYRGLGSDAYLVRPFSEITDVAGELSDAAVDNFDNTGLPFGPGDFTGGFQWGTRTIPAGGSQGYVVVLAVNSAATVPCPGDTNGDGLVDVSDLVNVILDWGTNGAAHSGDVNGSGTVDVADLVAVVLAWGPC
jgi:hypothetical protein